MSDRNDLLEEGRKVEQGCLSGRNDLLEEVRKVEQGCLSGRNDPLNKIIDDELYKMSSLLHHGLPYL